MGIHTMGLNCNEDAYTWDLYPEQYKLCPNDGGPTKTTHPVSIATWAYL
mgnify:CR=1 FL=1